MNDPRFTPEEQEFLNRSAKFVPLVRSEAWKEMKEYMNSLVEEALVKLMADHTHSPDLVYGLTMRWKQRGIMRDTVVQHFENMVEQRAEMLREEKENEYNPYPDAN